MPRHPRVESHKQVSKPVQHSRRTRTTPNQAIAAQKSTTPRSAPPAQKRNSTAVLKQYQDVLQRLAQSEALSSGDMVQAFRAISHTCAKLLRVNRTSIWLLSEDQNELIFLDLSEPRSGHPNPGLIFKYSDCPAYLHSLRRERRAVAIEQASQDPRTRDLAQIYFARFKIQSTLSAPIRRKGELVGILCAESVGKPRRWSQQDMYLCCMLATLATLALEATERHHVSRCFVSPKKSPRWPIAPRANFSPT